MAEQYIDGPIKQPTYPNTDKDVFVAGEGTPVFDGTIEQRNIGHVLVRDQPNPTEVILLGTGTPVFPGLARTFPDPIDFFDGLNGVIVSFYPGNALSSAEVTFLGPTINVG